MVKVEPQPILIKKSSQFVIGKKIYLMAHIIRIAYVVLAILPLVRYWFSNNYIDQDQFNMLYDNDFETKEKYIVYLLKSNIKL